MLRGATRRTLWIVWVCLLLARTSAADARAVFVDFDGDGLRDRAPVVQVAAPGSRIAAANVDFDRPDATFAAVDDASQSLPEDLTTSTSARAALTEVVQARAPAVTAATIHPADVDGHSRPLASPLGPRPPPSR